MKPRHKKIGLAVGLLALVGVGVGLVLNAFNSNLVFFYTPTQIAAKEAPQGRTFRVGGLVQAGTVAREVLAKHDENYMPPEAADALQKAGKMNAKVGSTVAQGAGTLSAGGAGK